MSANDLTIETLLRAHAPHAPESLRARVLALETAPARRRSPSRRRLVLVALPAACALAVAAALVNGALDSGDKGGVVAQPAPLELGRPSTTQLQKAPSAGGAGKGYSSPGADSAAVAAAPSIRSSRLAHTDASLQIRVADSDALSAATTRATQIATALGGYSKSVDYRTPTSGGGAAYIELRVPAQNVKVAVARLASLGTVVSQQLSVTDLQDRFRTQSAQIAQLHRRVVALQAALRDPALPEAQKVLLRIRLAESKRALAQRTSARKGTVSSGTTARISLVIGTKKAIAPVGHRGAAGRMLHSAVGFLALEGMIALYALIVLSPLAFAAALVWLWRRRSVDRLLATS
jgi:Domain of unknown function (DUF4349)